MNNRKTTKGRKRQIIMSAPLRLFVEKYLTAKGQRLKLDGAKKSEYQKYFKNRYKINPKAVPVKQIIHI